MAEEEIGRFTEWYRRTPVSLEFWEGVLTDERLIWCFVGESFSSLLLRADTGTYAREAVAERSPETVADFDDRNITMALGNLEAIRLEPGSLFRRPSLVVEWEGEKFELEAVSGSDPQTEFVESLADDERLAHVEIGIERGRF